VSATNRQEAMLQLGEALEAESEPRTLPPPSNPMATARELVAEKHHGNGSLMLRHWRGCWMR
jgi:hypothetical protein